VTGRRRGDRAPVVVRPVRSRDSGPVAAPPNLPTGTVTLLFSDIEGSTALARHLGARWPSVLDAHYALLRRAVTAHGGVEAGTAGDGLLAAFDSARDAVAAAADAQRAFAAYPWPHRAPVRVRIGLHTGEPVLSPEGYAGLDAHRGARVMAAGHGGQVLLTAAVVTTLGGELPPGVRVRDLGEHGLKDFPHPERLFQLLIAGLPATFPPLRATGGMPTNLPRPSTALIGRERESAELAALLGSGKRLVTLTGAGGVGKTRLALHVARELLAGLRDGAFVIELAAIRDPELVMATVAGALGVRPGPGEGVAEALARELADRELLLLLDNFEQVVSAAPALGSLLAATSELRLVVTSRTPLRIRDEHVFQVPPLAAAAAASLFMERASAVGGNVPAMPAEADSVAAICARLDGLPLAIELAAARTPLLPPRALLRRLDRRLELLNSGARDAEERQQTLRAAIEWSHDLLAEPDRVLLRRLAVFAGGCTVQAADEVCASEPLLDRLGALVEHNLVRSDSTADGEPRFAMLETIREYAETHLATSGEEETVRLRHAEYFAALAERLEPEVRSARNSSPLDLVETENDNLRAAIDWSHDTSRHELALRLTGALWWFWFVRGHWTEALVRLDAALSATPRAGPARARALLGRALFRVWLGQLQDAEADGQELLALAEEAGDRTLEAHAVDRLALAAHARGDYDRAWAMHQQVAALSRETGDTPLLSIALGNLADISLNQARFDRAVSLSEEAFEIARGSGNMERVATSLANLGSGLLGLGRAAEAAERFAESLRCSQEMGSPVSVGYALDGLGAAAASLGCFEHAARLLGAADAAFHTLQTTPQTFESRRRADVLALLRTELGADNLAAALAEGEGMAPSEAMARLLSERPALAHSDL
jgi:predicted ATPase/class 3 adenylate cyclase